MINKKVLVVIDNFKNGGAQDIVKNVILENHTRIDFSVCSLNGFDQKYQDVLNKINVEVVDFERSFLKFYGYLRLRAADYDAVNFNLEVCSIIGAFILKILGYKNKIIISIHGLKSQLRAGVFNIMVLVGRFVGACFIVEDLVTSRDLRKMAVAKENIFYIPIGIDINITSDKKGHNDLGKLKQYLGIGEKDFVLLNVARMIAGKGQIYLLEMMNLFKKSGIEKIKLIIIGYGRRRAALEAYVKKNNLADRVFILDRQDDLEPYYNLADIFLMPAIDEAMAVVVFYSFAYRTPVIAFNAGSVSEAITSGYNGELVKIGDYEALARAVTKIINDSNLRHKYIENSLSLLNEKFNLYKMINDYYKLYIL